MKTTVRFRISPTYRAAVISSLIAITSTGSVFGQEEEVLVLDNLKLLRPTDEACTVTFETEQDLQIIVRSSLDLKCWVFAGPCNEAAQGNYQFVDFGAIELPGQFYQFEVYDPDISLPPQLEQLRAELGDEQFAQWLESNVEQFGTLQGITQEQVEEMDQGQRDQFEQLEELLNYWLKDFHNEAAQLPLELELPTEFEEARIDWGDYDLAQFLVDNLDLWGNLQGVCEPLVIEWEVNDPPAFEEFRVEELVLNDWLENYLQELPPIILENFEEEENPLPQHLEQLRMELGDEGFADWLRSNLEQTGSLQGILEGEIPEEGSRAREEYDILEGNLQTWLHDFEKRDSR